MSLHPYHLEHVCSYGARLQNPPEMIGPLPEGIRANIYVTGGEVTGPKLRGILRPVGGDWITIRADGVAVIDVRATIETQDGALIYVTYSGIGDLGPDGHANFLRGELPKRTTLRTTPRLFSAHASYLWVNRLQFLNIGEVDFEKFEVHYDMYAVR